jgi:pilus assembly protein CpaC
VKKNLQPTLTLLAWLCAGAGLAQAQPASPTGRPAARMAPAPPAALAAAPPAAPGVALQPCTSVTVDAPSLVTLGKSSVIRLAVPVARMVVGGQPNSRTTAPTSASVVSPLPGPGGVASATPRAAETDGVGSVEITLLSPTELFFLGKKSGSMNVIMQSVDGRCFIRDIHITIDPGTLQAKLGELMPEESGIKVRGAENALVLSGQVSDAMKLNEVMSLATSYGDGKKVVNLLRVMTPQQVMLEVKIAEVSKTLLDRFGIDFSRMFTSADGLSSRVMSGIFGGGPALFGQFNNAGAAALTGRAAIGVAAGSAAASAGLVNGVGSASLLGIDAQKRDGLVRVLAEPNIMAISGQSASFLSGGRIFIPVAQNRDGGGSTITLEEKEFGVGLKFTPTVLDGTRVNLKLVSEVSELAQTGSPFTTVGGITSVLPSITSRRVDTTVQLNDGQSFAIAGLIKNNMTETISRFPGLGEIPVLGALFRSTEFQKDQSELIFVVTPRLVRPMVKAVMLPTDNHIEPNRAEVLFMGAAEARPAAAPAAPATTSTVQPAAAVNPVGLAGSATGTGTAVTASELAAAVSGLSDTPTAPAGSQAADANDLD